MGEEQSKYSILVGNLRERDHLNDLGVDGRIILRWIFMKRIVGAWTGTIWLWIGTGTGHLLMC
jgi:hypothetical protein